MRVVARDLDALGHLINGVLLPHPSVAHVRSGVVLERLKDTQALPVGDLLGR